MHILSLSTLIPEQICDTVRFWGYGGTKQRISHYCEYAAEFISCVLEDDRIDGAVFPRTCDSSRTIRSYLETCGKFLYSFHIPARRDKAAIEYLAGSIRTYQTAIEARYGVKITDVAERSELVNVRNRALRAVYEHLPEISYSTYLKTVHTLLQKPLREQEVPAEISVSGSSASPRVFVVGSTQTKIELMQQIEMVGMNIVGDRLPESRRLIFAPEVSSHGDIYKNIAKSLITAMPSPSQDAFTEILKADRDELLRKQVQGVILLTQKYCEPYDYLFPAYKRMLDGLGIPVLRVTETGSGAENAALAIETFADLL